LRAREKQFFYPFQNTCPIKKDFHYLTQEETKRLFAAISSKRDRAIFLTAYRYGLRAAEIGLLHRPDVYLKRGRSPINRLKGTLSGIYPRQPEEQKTLCSSLATRHDESPYLFISNRNLPIDRRTLWVLMQSYGETAGISASKRQFRVQPRYSPK